MKNAIVKRLEKGILLTVKRETYFIPFYEITKVVCDKPYIELDISTGKKHYFTHTLSGFCAGLPLCFMQCDKSTVVNLTHVTAIRKTDGGFVLSVNEDIIEVSNTRVNGIKLQFQKVKEATGGGRYCGRCNLCEVPV